MTRKMTKCWIFIHENLTCSIHHIEYVHALISYKMTRKKRKKKKHEIMNICRVEG